MNIRRRFTVASAVLALVFCARAQLASAQVLEQVPANAMVVVKVKNLDQLSKKVAKMAKDLGLDQMAPEWADPLGSLEEQAQISKGLNRGGDLAFVFVDPATVGGNPQQAMMFLVPVNDYNAFVGNFKDAQQDGDITKATQQEGGEDVFLAKRGNFAAVAPSREILAQKPDGLRLQGVAAREADAKDVIMYANMKVIRENLLPQLKEGRQEMLREIENGLAGEGGENAKKFGPLAKAAANQMLNVAEEFLKDANAATVGVSLTDAGLTTTVMADFEPTSYIGELAKGIKNTDGPLVTGLPDRKYFAYGGATMDPQTTSRVFNDVIGPIAKELGKVEDAKAFSTAVDAWKQSLAATQGFSFGYVSPTAPLGQESVLQMVMVLKGDAAQIQASNRQMMSAMNDIYKLIPAQEGSSVSVDVKPDAKTVAGVKLDTFETKMKFNEADPQAEQAKQIIAFIYGRDGMTGTMGPVNRDTFVAAQGAPEELVADAISSAKAGTDTLARVQGVQTVKAQLPKSRALVGYIEVDQMVNTGLRYAKGFGADVPMKLPGDLPPIGFTAGSEQSAIRVDSFIPMDLVKGLVASAMEAQRAVQQPGGGL